MPCSKNSERQTITIAFSECAMHCGVAGQTLEVIEEDLFYNGKIIPIEARCGCYVISESGARIPMLKGEAGWR